MMIGMFSFNFQVITVNAIQMPEVMSGCSPLSPQYLKSRLGSFSIMNGVAGARVLWK